MLASEWENLVKDALKNWYDTDKLNQHPLTDLNLVSRQCEKSTYVNDPYQKARALREVMRAGIASLGVDGEDPPDPNNLDDPRWMRLRWRPYNILTLLPRYKIEGITSAIGLAPGGQYYRDQNKAIKMLAEVLRQGEGNPIEEASAIPLLYPSGAVKLTDHFYIERNADLELSNALSGPGETITIRGSRQVGKTSLLIRGMHAAQRRYDARVVYFDMQNAGAETLASLDDFLRTIIDWIFDDLDMDLDIVAQAWQSRLPAQRKLTKLLERHVLSKAKTPLLLAMDEIDQLQSTDFHSDFFGLIRSWHNLRASRPQWDKLSVIMAISTEPYLLIADLNQSPFNVGQVIYMQDFDEEQIAELNRRYGRPLSDTELQQLMLLLNGHPYLIRVAFYTTVVDKQSWSDFATVASSDQGPFRQHLQHQYQLLIRDPALHRAMKEIVQGRRCSDDKANFRLMKAGLVVKDGDCYACRSELYQQYFAGKL